MSTTVDQRVVEMRFDNKQFESNVSTTMSTLDKLKQRLNLTGAAKGFEDIGTAARGVNLSGLSGAVEAVQTKFSALQVMGVTALANITNSAVNAGKRIASALTIEPIKTGLSEYETQINAVQTILANTESKGTTLGQVNTALDTLNKYADKTIYNFTEMTRNIGTFTAAGVDLDTSVSAIQGIANLAAVSGSTSQQASTAMYQLSQALASGTVKLMDWNSVVNAGMGGQVFQDALKETARVHGVEIDAMIERNGSFRESLQEGWITADILTETLSHFTMAAEEGSKQWDAYKKTLMDSGYSEEQANAILKLSNTATDAATKVKTATQLWDTLKETAQSGWTQTWEIILGDFGEAKELFSGIYETLSPILEATAEARNKLLSGGLSSGWKQLISEGIPDEEGYRDSIKNVAKDHGIAIDDMIAAEKKLDSSLDDNEAFQKVLKKGLQDGSITSDMLSESVTHLADKMRNMTDAEREAAGYTEEHIAQIEELEKGLKDGSISMDEFTEKMMKPSGRENIISGLKNAFDGLMNIIKPIKDAFRDIFPPMTSDQIYGFTENFKALTNTFKEFGTKYADQIKRTFKGVFSIIDIGKKIFTAFGNSIMDLVGSSGVSSLGEFVMNSLASIGDFFTSINDKFDIEGVSGMFSAMGSGISSALGKTVDILKGFGSALSTIGDIICDVASAIWSGVKTAFGWISENFSIGDIFAGLAGGGIFVLAKKLAGFVKQLSELFDGGLMGALFGKKDGEDGDSIKDKISDLFDGVGDAIQGFTSSVKVGSFVAIAAAIAILTSAFGKLAELDAVDIGKSLVTMGVSLGIMMKALNGMPTATKLTSGLTKFTESTSLIKSGIALMMLAKSIDILANAMIALSDLSWEEIGKGLAGVGGGIVLLCGGLKILNGTKISLGTSVAMLALAEACKILGDAMQKFVGFSWDEIARGLIGMGGALGEMVISLSVLSKVGGFGAMLGGTGILIAVQSLSDLAEGLKSFANMSWDEIGRGLAGMGGALAEVAGITGALGMLAGFSSIFASGAILITVQSLAELAESFKSFGNMSWGEIGRGLAGMGGALAEVAGITGGLGMLAGFSSLFAAGSIVLVIQGLSDLAESFKSFGNMSWDEIGRGLTGMGGALAEVAAITGGLGMLAGFSSLFAAGSILITVQGLSDLAEAFGQFGSMSWDEIGRGIVAMGGALAEVAGITGALGALAGLPALLGGGAILLAVQGLGDLADALQKFGDMSWDEIGRGLAAMAGALGEVALGGLLSTLSGFGAMAISEMAAPLGVLAESVQKWSGVSVPDGLGTQLSNLALGIMEFTFGGLGASALAEAAPAVGIMADSVSKWSGVTVPGNIGASLEALAAGVKAFTWGGMGASAIADVAAPLGEMADSVAKWSGVVIPENLGTNLETLGAGVLAFTFGGSGASSLAEAAPGVGAMADAVSKWTGVTIPENLGTSLETLGAGVKAFTFGGSGASSLTEAAPGVGAMADAVMKWAGVTIPEGLVDKLDTLSDGVKKFTFAGSGADSIATVASGLGEMADSAKKWSGVVVPENLGTNLSTLSSGVKSFTFGGSGAETLSIAATGLNVLADSVAKWSNVVIPEDLGTNLSTLATSVKSFVGIEDISVTATDMDSLAASLSKLAGVSFGVVSQGLSGLATSISDLSSVSDLITGLGTTIYDNLITPLSNASKDMSGTGSNIVKSLANGLRSGATAVASAADSLVNSLVNTLNSQASVMLNVGELLATNLAAGIDASTSNVTKAAKSLSKSTANAFSSQYSNFYDAGCDVVAGLVQGILSGMMMASAAGTAIAQAAYKAAKAYFMSCSPSKLFDELGRDVVAGLVQGMDRTNDDAADAGSDLATSAIDGLVDSVNDAAETYADVNSPSKVMYKVGEWTATGFINAINDYNGKAADAGTNMAASTIDSLSSTVSKISDIISSDIDAQPTIRPVLDLSDVESGAGRIGNMLSSNSFGVASNLGAISTMMNRRSRNGNIDDVVSAIDRLNNRLDNVGNTTYSINGITYDDGSSVSRAIGEITRYAIMERRV